MNQISNNEEDAVQVLTRTETLVRDAPENSTIIVGGIYSRAWIEGIISRFKRNDLSVRIIPSCKGTSLNMTLALITNPNFESTND